MNNQIFIEKSEAKSDINEQEILKSDKNLLDLVFNSKKEKGLKYRKMPYEIQKILIKMFNENPYPEKEKCKNIAEKYSLSTLQILNWFKFQRKKFLKTGPIKAYKKRKILQKEELDFLESNFRKNKNPHPNEFAQMSKYLSCHKKQIRNWFAYRRKKLNKLHQYISNLKFFYCYKRKESFKKIQRISTPPNSSLQNSQYDKHSTESTNQKNSNNFKKETQDDEKDKKLFQKYGSNLSFVQNQQNGSNNLNQNGNFLNIDVNNNYFNNETNNNFFHNDSNSNNMRNIGFFPYSYRVATMPTVPFRNYYGGGNEMYGIPMTYIPVLQPLYYYSNNNQLGRPSMNNGFNSNNGEKEN